MATLTLTGGVETVSWKVTGLTNPFNTTYYKKLVICTGYVSDGSSSAPSDIVSTKVAASSSSTTVSGSFSYSAGTYRFRSYAQAANSLWYSIDSATVTVSAATTSYTYKYKINVYKGPDGNATFYKTFGTYSAEGSSSGVTIGLSSLQRTVESDSGLSGYEYDRYSATSYCSKTSSGIKISSSIANTSNVAIVSMGYVQPTYTAYIKYYPNGGYNSSGTAQAVTKSYENTSSSVLCYVDDNSSLGFYRTGYTFQGWAKSSSGSVAYDGGEGVYVSSGSTLSLYAVWAPNTYTIYFNGNGATSGSMSAMYCDYGTSYTLTSNAYSKTSTLTYNYNFSGASNSTVSVPWSFDYWSCSNGNTYSNRATVSNLTTGSSVTMYAQWEAGSVTLQKTSRSGYVFDGWYTKASGGTYVGMGGDSYTVSSSQTLYAHWSETVVTPSLSYQSHTDTTITVSLNRNGGTSGSWLIEASTSSAFGTIKASYTVSNTSTTTITLSGLSPDTKYYIRATNISGSAEAVSSSITAYTRISQFQWTSDDANNIVAGEAFEEMILASKWNDLIDRVDWCRSQKGLTSSGQADVSVGSEMSASRFNAMRNAIASMTSSVTGTKSSGDEILATYFANSSSSLKTTINSIIVSL